MGKNWIVKSAIPEKLKSNFEGLHPILAQVLYNRGIVEQSNIADFLQPDYARLHSPFLFEDMEKAVSRIWQAIEKKEKILIYGDYDADAVTANAVMQQTFRYLGVDVQSYVPDRFSEGYGLNIEAFQKFAAEGVAVVITVDCGTNSVDIAEFCSANNIDLIITDHHEITAGVPKSFALINPKNPNDKYPDDQITGVGVAYKLASALLSRKSNVESEKLIVGWDKWLLDLVAIGTVADCHSLLGENRILVALGLKVMPKTKWVGLKTLLSAIGADKNPIDATTLGFSVAPRINAAGRLEHADIALALLLETDPMAAALKAAELEKINKRRQDITMRVVSEAQEQATFISDRKILLVAHPSWHKGVVGLAAGRLAEVYQKPVIVLERGELESTGSARSGGDFNIVECLKSAQEHLIKFGGHKQAAGLTVKSEHIDTFYSQILQYAENNWPEEGLSINLELDAALSESDLTAETAYVITAAAPFGVGNKKPQFLLSDAAVVSTRLVGNGAKHLQLKLRLGSTIVDAIAFNWKAGVDRLLESSMVDVACELLVDVWQGFEKLKLRVVDIRPTEVVSSKL